MKVIVAALTICCLVADTYGRLRHPIIDSYLEILQSFVEIRISSLCASFTAPFQQIVMEQVYELSSALTVLAFQPSHARQMLIALMTN